ncbi:dienelactone hydrolase family protein [Cumulibacter soli]|uniref:dienelactone hydrolase family protein n=1 Tax=Cumulibacter soli TaxID=2546344 RepID=UPI001068ACB3|nr:dienelactone hydrolase family protein [Cumulibacter soli]
MANVVLFHSAVGANEGFHKMADLFVDAGHTVHRPDYYDGHTFPNATEGTAYRDEVGFGNLAQHASDLIADLEGPLVFGGFSLGAAMAQSMGKRDPRASAALLFHAGGVAKPTSWQSHVPLQIHHSVDDPWIDEGNPDELVRSAARSGAQAAHYVYPGSGHVFGDPTGSDYNEELATLMWSRVFALIG